MLFLFEAVFLPGRNEMSNHAGFQNGGREARPGGTLLERVRHRLRFWLRYPAFLRARWQDARLARGVHHELAVCAIFREEEPFLSEWLHFHEKIGVTKFYLYNNFSTDSFAKVLAPFVARGVVELTDWPFPVGQLSAYRHCLRRHRLDARWVALIDIDEFLFSPASENLPSVLREFADLPGIVVYSAYFGSNGHARRPPALVLEAFTRRAPHSLWTAKTIVNPRHVYKVGIHTSKYLIGDASDTARRSWDAAHVPVWDRLRINHYWSRSLEDLDAKIARGDASTSTARDPAWHHAFESGLNAEEDRAILEIPKRQSRGDKPGAEGAVGGS